MFITPSFSFSGDAEEAIKFYQKALGADIEGIMHYRDMPGADPDLATADKMMHGVLKFAAGYIYFNDYFSNGGVTVGNNVELVIGCDSPEEVDTFFTGLSDGALQIVMEPQQTFWGGYYALLKDRYGIGWAFNYQKDQEG